MDIEFHYYITYIIARTAGFKPEDAQIIAYSSQYTDDNQKVYRIHQGHPDEYSNYISQTINILKPRKELIRIYPVFHFMPGTLPEIARDSARRRDGKLHLMNTIADGSNSRQLFQAALYSQNLYRIGIATHMHADTFAHQNFLGFEDVFNDMKGLIQILTPGICHADAQHDPDTMALLWEDERLVPSHSEINNRARFLGAAGCIYEQYAHYLNNSADSRDLIAQLEWAIGGHDDNSDQRIDRYKELIGAEFVEYDGKGWFKKAIDFVNEDVSGQDPQDTLPISGTEWVWTGDYKESDWYKFQEAVKSHQWLAMDAVVSPIFKQMEFVGL
jgi:hypothetical protein